MAKIIREDFTAEDFNQIVNEFLYIDSRVSMPIESLNNLKEHLVKAGPSFQRMFHAYFEKEDNTRYDALTRRMESFAKKLTQYNADLKGEERRVFFLFWSDIAEMVKDDCAKLQVQYLTNSCNYFIWEINKLS